MTATGEVAELLRGTRLFGELDDAALGSVVEALREERLAPGRTIFSRGEEAIGLYLVAEGRVRLSVFSVEGRELTFRFADRGDVLGEIAVIDGGTRSADAVAVTEVRTLVLSRARFRQLMEARPEIARGIVGFLCERLRETSSQMEEIALYPIERRVARFILSALRISGHDLDQSKVGLDLKMTQGEIALLLGTSRPKVTVAMGALEADGAISRSGEGMTCHPSVLLRIAGADGE